MVSLSFIIWKDFLAFKYLHIFLIFLRDCVSQCEDMVLLLEDRYICEHYNNRHAHGIMHLLQVQGKGCHPRRLMKERAKIAVG
jgi:hypothetical protein